VLGPAIVRVQARVALLVNIACLAGHLRAGAGMVARSAGTVEAAGVDGGSA